MSPKKRLSILMADDGSQHAQAAGQLLGSIPLPPKSRVSILRVFSSGQITALPEMEKALESTKERLLQMGISAEKSLVLGYPAEKIIETAETEKPDLIVLGAKGLRATLGILLGGVAQQVIEYASCPVLVVRAPYQGLRRILVVTDGSPYSQRAARYLGKFPLPKNVEVHVAHVLPSLQQPINMDVYMGAWQTAYYTPAMTETEADALNKKQETKGHTLLMRTHILLQREGLDPIPVLLRGDAATEIIEYVKAHQIDLIVAGSRGLSEFKGWWLGSVSRKLVHYSNCSVLIVKGPHKA